MEERNLSNDLSPDPNQRKVVEMAQQFLPAFLPSLKILFQISMDRTKRGKGKSARGRALKALSFSAGTRADSLNTLQDQAAPPTPGEGGAIPFRNFPIGHRI